MLGLTDAQQQSFLRFPVVSLECLTCLPKVVTGREGKQVRGCSVVFTEAEKNSTEKLHVNLTHNKLIWTPRRIKTNAGSDVTELRSGCSEEHGVVSEETNRTNEFF